MISLSATLFCLSVAGEFDGRVIDAQNGKGLLGVNIEIIGQAQGTATDREGFFSLKGEWSDTLMVVFSHVGYLPQRLTIGSLRQQKVIELEPKPIIFKGIEITGEYKKYQVDVPTDVKIIDQETISAQAPLDLGDLLRGETALQVQTTSPGYQTVSIRGANPDQVIIVYDGIPIQSTQNAIGDISWIDINDIKELQVIKSSQTTVYGEGSLGGVLNIEGATDSPYLLTLSGRLGNYALRDGYLGLGHDFGKLFAKYSCSYKSAEYSGEDFLEPLKTESLYHNLVTSYTFNDNQIILRGIVMERDLDQMHTIDRTDGRRTLGSILYRGKIKSSPGWFSQLFYRGFRNRDRYFTIGQAHQPQARVITNRYNDEVTGWRGEKATHWGDLLVNLGGEYLHSRFASRTLWDFIDNRTIDSLRFIQKLERNQVGFFTVIKYHTETGLDFLPWMDWNWSGRYDQALTERYYLAASTMYPQAETGATRYHTINYKIGIELGGKSSATTYSFYINNGANSRFPSLYDLYLNDVTVSPIYRDSTVFPERVVSSEMGLTWGRKWQSADIPFRSVLLKAIYFCNDFSDKIYYKPFAFSTPVALNATTAKIQGYEFNATLELVQPVTITLGAQFLNISDENLFPNKPDVKYQAEFSLSHAGFNLRLRGFYEGQEMANGVLPGGMVHLQAMQARRDVDMTMSYRLNWQTLDIWMKLAVLNLFAQTDETIAYDFLDRVRMVQFNIGFGIK